MSARESRFGFVRAWARMESSERIALSALIVAVLALVATGMQVFIAWQTRNDAARSALRAEQLRACVAFRITSSKYAAHLSTLADDVEASVAIDSAAEAARFGSDLDQYQRDLDPLYYLLPRSDLPAVRSAALASAGPLVVLVNNQPERLPAISRQLDEAHDAVEAACESVIRDVRDERVPADLRREKPSPD
jgi:hypothetical protein